MLSLSGFEKKYPSGFEVVIPQLDLPEGIHLILGGNGSGKSTLLKALAGIHPANGEVLLNGTSLSSQPIHYRRKIGFSAAEPTFPEYLNLTDLITVVAKAKQSTHAEIAELTTILEVGEFMTYPIGGYSSGMLKKSALMLAFLGKPELIILDEPFTTIDAQTQGQLVRLICQRAKEGTGFLITSHQSGPIELLPVMSVLHMRSGKLATHE
ncbi:ABC-2 type transport system ATP-binding protein [Algoriphagus aquaeductus]|uniref:ABC-2 type transport system ATP-binding protein n=1 Tax=Algoriphagus aquaeductus TaxID=475299 RepID=A0A326RQI3_9BACT|nr:ABC transporter ATP-binding protein [Algoriphagus aquaeductus]PZV79686.1 ABC-2 type transport system ATP-binding protein [Algoriphagus aquaeductus]